MPLSIAGFVYDLDVDMGGMEIQAMRLFRELGSRGHEVTVFTWPAGREDLPRVEQREGYRLERFPTRLGLFSRVAIEYTAWQLARELSRRPRPDVLYAVQAWGGYVASAASELNGVPFAVKLACSGPYGDLPALEQAGERDAIAALRRADSVVCINGEVVEQGRTSGIPRAALRRIRNGIEVERLARAEPLDRGALGCSADDVLLLFVGRLTHQKRVHVLLEALADAREVHPELRLLLAGVGPDSDALAAQAARLGLSEHVNFLGQRDDVDRLLRTADGFVLPSCSEGISNALLEALAAGVPAIVSRIPGNLDVVGEEGALLVDVDDVGSLSTALVGLASDPAGSEARVAEARRRLEAEFTIEAVADAYEELFRELSARGRERRPRRLVGRFSRQLLAFTRERTTHYTKQAFHRTLFVVRRGISDAVVRGKVLAGVEGEVFSESGP